MSVRMDPAAFPASSRSPRAPFAARRGERIDAIAQDIREEGGRAATCVVDVTEAEDLRRLVSTTVDQYCRIDVLVNNAGIASISPLADLDTDGWSAMIDVNLRGMLNGVAAALPVFREQGSSIISVAGLSSVSPSMAVYAATKNAVRTVHEGLRTESTDGVVRTTAISPGYVRTDLVDSMADPQIREQTRKHMDAMGIPPAAVARAAAFAIEQPGDVEIGEINVRPTVQA
ncbi:SDR family oxidoreductase [Streptomyces swartbergensis]